MKLNFIPAVPEDAQILFDWRNDPLTRAQSHQTEVLVWSDHLKWFEKSLQMPTRHIFFAVDRQDPGLEKLATIRSDDLGEVKLLSWSVNPAMRGRGVGRALLSQFIESLPGAYRAEIRKDNIASIKMARAAGFNCLGSEDQFEVWTFDSKS